jgi:gas vesicle protein
MLLQNYSIDFYEIWESTESESLLLVECAMAEKDAAILRETQAGEENVQLQKMMASIVEETGARVKEEVKNIKQQYNKKLEVLVRDMKKSLESYNCNILKLRGNVEKMVMSKC